MFRTYLNLLFYFDVRFWLNTASFESFECFRNLFVLRYRANFRSCSNWSNWPQFLLRFYCSGWQNAVQLTLFLRPLSSRLNSTTFPVFHQCCLIFANFECTSPSELFYLLESSSSSLSGFVIWHRSTYYFSWIEPCTMKLEIIWVFLNRCEQLSLKKG